jgi:hypothetical protein
MLLQSLIMKEVIMFSKVAALKAIFAFFLIFISFGCIHSSARANDKTDLSNVAFEIVEGDLGSAQIKIAAIVDGEMFEFQLDTGANNTFLGYSPLLVNYPVTGQSHTTSAAGVTVIEDKIKVLSLKIGVFEKKDFEVIRYKEGSRLKNRLGMNALPEKLGFDFKNKKINFGLSSPTSLQKNALETYWDSSFGMKIDLGSDVVDAIWDTGAELSVVDQDLIHKNPNLFQHLQTIDGGRDATGNPVKLELYKFSGLQVGGKHLSGTIMSMDFKPIQQKMGSNVKLILGTNLIRMNNWFFDRTEKTWSIE